MWTTLGYRIMRGVSRAVPPPAARAIIPVIAAVGWAGDVGGRRNMRRNLDGLGRICGKDFSGLDRAVYRHFISFIYEFLRPGPWQTWPATVEEDLRRAFGPPGERRPALLLTAHHGNWEAALRTLLERGYRVHTVVMRHADPVVDGFFTDMRRHPLLTTSAVEEGLGPCRAALREGRVLALACERDYGGGGLAQEMAGARFRFPPGPAFLWRMCRPAVVLAATPRSRLGEFAVNLETVDIPEDMAQDRDAVKLATGLVAGRVLAMIGRAPAQWITFGDYFSLEARR